MSWMRGSRKRLRRRRPACEAARGVRLVHYSRLAQIKAAYDADNFCLNNDIRLAAPADDMAV